MASRGAKADKEEYQTETACRMDFIKEIIKKLIGSRPNQSSIMLPTVAEERSFEEALKNVVRIVSSNKLCSPVNIGHDPLRCFLLTSSDGKTRWNRKQCLKEILNHLSWMERERLYSPPADDEIRYYLQIKKYMRSILAFYSDVSAISSFKIKNIFGCVSFFKLLRPAEELAELNQHLANLSEVLLKKGVNDGIPFKPIMVVDDNSDIASSIHGSKERSYKFYAHKFKLALVDLRFTEYAILPPFKDEKASYVRVLGSIAPPLIQVQDEMSVHCNVLNKLFLQRLYRELQSMRKHCDKIKDWILKNLSLTEHWETIKETYEEYNSDEYDNDVYLVEFKNTLAEKWCQVSNEELPNYVAQLDHFLTVARNLLVHVMCCIYDDPNVFDFHNFDDVPKGWEALHALTLSKCGSFVGNIIREVPIIASPDKQANGKLDYRTTCEHVPYRKNKHENTRLLRAIIENIKKIGDSNVELDNVEMTLVHKIWGRVASSTHFFISALAYEQKRHVMLHSELLNVETLRSRVALSSRRKRRTDEETIDDIHDCLMTDMFYLTSFLKTCKEDLVVKLVRLQSMRKIDL